MCSRDAASLDFQCLCHGGFDAAVIIDDVKRAVVVPDRPADAEFFEHIVDGSKVVKAVRRWGLGIIGLLPCS